MDFDILFEDMQDVHVQLRIHHNHAITCLRASPTNWIIIPYNATNYSRRYSFYVIAISRH
jgi:hypothetical protein